MSAKNTVLKTGKAAKNAAAKTAKTAKTAHPAPQKTAGKAGATKLSALAAAARVLGEAKQPMSCPELIEAMAARGYWTSPTGKTPAATLSAAMQREIVVKKDRARFQKTGPGRYALA
jgi:hypothetical protein